MDFAKLSKIMYTPANYKFTVFSWGIKGGGGEWLNCMNNSLMFFWSTRMHVDYLMYASFPKCCPPTAIIGPTRIR